MAKAKKVEAAEETPVKKVSPKTSKKAEAPAPAPAKKAKAEPADDNLIHLKDLCEKYGVNPRDARIKLRKTLERGEGARWSWDEDDDEVDQVKEILKQMADRKAGKDEEEEAPAKAKGKKVAKEETPAPKKAAKKSKAKAQAEDKDEDEDD